MEKKTERWDLRVIPSLNEDVTKLAEQLNKSRNRFVEHILLKATAHPELFFVCCPQCNEPQFDVWEIVGVGVEGVQKFECSQGHSFVYDFDQQKIL
jgi:hypothetical protein